ncbi:MAG TPA: hypothetical protein VHN80_13600, partial [Kineosporiaceae bacterium]|nr:hypothetical protein [Kineosporiaceae bacterium]
VRAACSCGFTTTGRADERRAREALEREHGSSAPTCVLCGRNRADSRLPASRRYERLDVVSDVTGEQYLICGDDPVSCLDLIDQRHVMRADAGAAVPRPRLRLVGPDERPGAGD